ncbi:GroES-like protein [Crepidotus variabilis]|uniref:GroES-like protein n=1 Tax=Crepidotus variabilis TaxID=179855 RepID=A0A9P6JP49_9AGAR|nr:GroES-like protein [Crepidotus variabilis]
MPQAQTALVIPAHLGQFKLAQIPVYSPGPGQLLIKVYAAGLNPADWKLQTSGNVVNEFPAVLGLDRVGEVVELGDTVEGFARGDRVITSCHFIENQFQGFQQYAIANASVTGKIPANVTYDEAATIPICLGTAFSALFSEVPHGAGLPAPWTSEGRNIGSGKAILILGGASSVGQFAIQLAKLIGYSTIIATASLKNEALLKSHGATYVLDRSLDATALTAAVSDVTSKGLLGMVVDAIGLESTEKLGIAVLDKWHGQTGQKGTFTSSEPQTSALLKAQTALVVANAVGIPSLPWNTKLFNVLFHDELPKWLKTGAIQPTRLEVLEGGLSAIPAGLKRLENNQVSGLKLVVRPHETV